MAFRSFGFHVFFRVLAISIVFAVGFGLEGHAQTPASTTATTPSRTVTGDTQGQLTSTEGKMAFPFFYGAKVGDACNPYVDYNCELSEAALKAAQDAAAKSGKCDPYIDYKCLDT
jgi:hypothetical protein